MDRDDDYVPLFFYIEEPIGVIIIDNEIIHLEQPSDMRGYGGYAFYLLDKLSRTASIGTLLPKKFMEKRDDYFASYEVYWPCLTGILYEFNHCRCLSARVTVKRVKTDSLVQFSDFAVMNGEGRILKVDKIPGQIFLHPQEAFILLANQVASSYSDLIFYEYETTQKELYREQLRENIRKYFNKEQPFNKPFPYSANKYYTAFNLDYFEYLENQILADKLTPFEILKLSGPMVINQLSAFMLKPEKITRFIDATALDLINNYDALPTTLKVLFLTLHLSAEDFGYPYISSDFTQNEETITNKVLREYSKPFPPYPEGVDEDIFEIWKRYDLPEQSNPYYKYKHSR